MSTIETELASELDIDPVELQRVRLNQETSRIPWSELQRFFAQGDVIWVHDDLDLIEMALRFTLDDAAAIDVEMKRGRLSRASDDQARGWFESQSSLWAVVVKPWILVQETRCTSGSTRTPVQG